VAFVLHKTLVLKVIEIELFRSKAFPKASIFGPESHGPNVAEKLAFLVQKLAFVIQ
jgi:hypothetical protein